MAEFKSVFHKSLAKKLILSDGKEFEFKRPCNYNVYGKTRLIHKLINIEWLIENNFISFSSRFIT